MVRAKASTNIALIKYWGKKDENLFLPNTTSLSLTLDNLYTITSVQAISGNRDIFILDNQLMNQKETKKISNFIDLFRNDNIKLKVVSNNNFPTAAGLASSASGFAALATALNKFYNLNLSKEDLSKKSRLGSGSSTRSLFDKFAIWQKGDDNTSYAYHLESDLDIEMIFVIVDGHKKEFSSRDMMKQTVEQSLFYDAFVKQNDHDLEAMIQAIKAKDIKKVGEIAERNAFMMHGTLLANKTPYFYIKPQSLEIFEFVKKMRKENIVAYVTMDAGPNVKIITDSKNRDIVYNKLKEQFNLQLIVAKPGKGASII